MSGAISNAIVAGQRDESVMMEWRCSARIHHAVVMKRSGTEKSGGIDEEKGTEQKKSGESAGDAHSPLFSMSI